ncbi:MAG: Asr1405/Asl0597 family protein [Nodosilinea sp.]
MQALKSDYAQSGPDLQAAAPAKTVVELDRVSRWTVYQRLQELGLVCECGCDRPLAVAIDTPAAAFQVWGVVQAVTQSKLSLTDHLERCWQQRTPR